MAPAVGGLGPHSGRYNSMASAGNPATILLVDDDEAIRSYVRPILQQQGFHVIEASDGAEALKVASAYAEPVDVLLTDVIMPKVNGLVLTQRLLQERPGIGVLYMSGYFGEVLVAGKPSRIDPNSKAFYSGRTDCGRASNT